MMQNVFFFAFSSVQCFKFVIPRFLWLVKARVCYADVRYAEMIYKTFVRTKQRKLDFGS